MPKPGTPGTAIALILVFTPGVLFALALGYCAWIAH